MRGEARREVRSGGRRTAVQLGLGDSTTVGLPAVGDGRRQRNIRQPNVRGRPTAFSSHLQRSQRPEPPLAALLRGAQGGTVRGALPQPPSRLLCRSSPTGSTAGGEGEDEAELASPNSVKEFTDGTKSTLSISTREMDKYDQRVSRRHPPLHRPARVPARGVAPVRSHAVPRAPLCSSTRRRCRT